MKISLITEGGIDQALVPCLLSAIAQRAGVRWPLSVQEDFQTAQIRKRGYGGVLEKMRSVVMEMEAGRYVRPDLLVVVLDHRKTSAVVDEIRAMSRGIDWIVMGIAIEEIEAWWLADRTQVLGWLEISDDQANKVEYTTDYAPERDGAVRLGQRDRRHAAFSKMAVSSSGISS